MTLFGKAVLCGLETQNYLGKISLNLVASSWNMIPCFSREFLGLYFQFVNAFFLINILAPNSILVQVNLCQKVLFLHQLTHNMTTDLFIELQVQYMKIPSSNLGSTCCVQKLFLTFRTFFVHNMFSPCSAKTRTSDKDLPVIRKF